MQQQRHLSPIVGSIYAEFHPIYGPRIVFGHFQEAKRMNMTSFLPLFDQCSEYILPKSQLCGRVIQIFSGGFHILGCPMNIQDKKYERNTFLFNLCFVFEEHAELNPFRKIIQKIGFILRISEMESNFLSNELTKLKMNTILDRILDDLNQYQECCISLTECHTLNLKLFPNYPSFPIKVYYFDVPVPLVPLIADEDWDYTISKIVPYINGIDHVKKIAEKAEVDLNLTRKAIEHLLYYKGIDVIDIFQFSNMYGLCSPLTNLVQDPYLQKECLDYISVDSSSRESLSFSRILELYSYLQHGITIKEFCKHYTKDSSTIDLRRFIGFGLLKKFLRRIHKYPVHDPSSAPSQSVMALSSSQQHTFYSLLNGKHHYDELCTKYGLSYHELDSLLSEDQSIHFIYR